MMAPIEADTINPATVITREEAAPDRRAGHDHLAQAAGIAGRRRED